jgi:dolichol kinase
MRTLIGAAAGFTTGGAACFVKDSGAGVFVGALTAITVWFWAWGNVPGDRRG